VITFSSFLPVHRKSDCRNHKLAASMKPESNALLGIDFSPIMDYHDDTTTTSFNRRLQP
jgi:hypothetical protein